MTLWVDPAPSMRTSTDLPRRAPGSWARALVSTLMWSAAVFDPALPGRSAIANGSPVPSGPWSTNAHNGWNPNPFLNVGRAFSFSNSHRFTARCARWRLERPGPRGWSGWSV